jgi:hypothetical protein
MQRGAAQRRFRQRSIEYLARVMDKFHATLDVYTDADAAGNHFPARGRFNSAGGEDAVPPMMEDSTEQPYAGLTCIKATFKSRGLNWGGWYWMNGVLRDQELSPTPNWGDQPNAGVDLRGATKLTFYARGAEGGEHVEFFALGVGRDAESGTAFMPHPDSSPKVSLGYVTLTPNWKKYTLDLAGKNLGYTLGGFGWVAAADRNPNRDITFYLDEIKYDKQRLSEPRLLASFETMNVNDFDRVARNVAFTYDNAVALIAFLVAGERERARLLADALVYAQEHDRFYTDGRIRNAYQAGDLILSPGWTPYGKTDRVRTPGFTDPKTGIWAEDEFQVSTHTGNVAWAMLALLAYYQWAGGSKYLTAAEKMGEWVERNCRDLRGAGGYTGGFDGGEPMPKKRFYKATEHNIDLLAAFQQLFVITKDAKWRERSEHAKKLVQAMWDEAEGKFWTGTGEDGVTIGKDNIPVDIQPWALLALGEESRPYWRALAYAEIHHKVGEGYDFNNDRDGIWHEGTAQMAVAYWHIGQPAQRQRIVNYLGRAQLRHGGIYATEKEEPGKDKYGIGLTTGFYLNDGQPWLYFRRLHVGATAWLALAERNINPFSVVRPADKVSLSGKVTDRNGTGISDVTVRLSGSEQDVTPTDANGNYSFANLLQGGSYTLTPTKANLAFAPRHQSFDNLRSNRTGDFTSILVPIITSISPTYALQGASIPSFTITGVNLTGSTFSFVPALNPPAISVRSATINASGTAATLNLAISSSALGLFNLAATNAVGSSDNPRAAGGVFRVLDPRLDSDGDGYPDGVEVEVRSDPTEADITPLTVTPPVVEAVVGTFSFLNLTNLSQTSDPGVFVGEAVGMTFSLLNTADPSQTPPGVPPDPGLFVGEAVGTTFSILNLADPSQTPVGVTPDLTVFVGEAVGFAFSIRNTASLSSLFSQEPVRAPGFLKRTMFSLPHAQPVFTLQPRPRFVPGIYLKLRR